MPVTRLELKKKRIREFFSTFRTEKKGDFDEIKREFYKKGLIYVQMQLSVKDITKEFEDSLKRKIEQNIIKAKIRVASKEDLESLMNIYNKSWLTSNTPFRPITIDTLKSILEDEDTIFLIAKVYGRDSGFIILSFEGENNEIAEIEALGILPRFQRKGLGTILGMGAWNYLKEKNVKEILCEVYENNQASYSFIKALGFKEYGKVLYNVSDFSEEDEKE